MAPVSVEDTLMFALQKHAILRWCLDTVCATAKCIAETAPGRQVTLALKTTYKTVA